MNRCLLLWFTATLVAVQLQASLVGHWTFDGSNPLADRAGNFPDLILEGSASISGGQLDVDGSGTTATGWAVSDPAGTYSGPPIVDKTLVSYLTLQGLEGGASAGSALTINRPGVDYFDAIVFAERESNRWMAGSTLFQRYTPFAPGFEETTTGQRIQIVITYEDLGGGDMMISGYRNGVLIGSYLTPNASSWPGDAEVFFGLRHIFPSGARVGAIDALIDEACIYDEALTQAQISGIRQGGCVAASQIQTIPTASTWGLIVLALLLGLSSTLVLRMSR